MGSRISFIRHSTLHTRFSANAFNYTTFRSPPISSLVLIFKMSDAEKPQSLDDEQEQIVSAYVPPPQKSIGELIAADQEDESLRKYKEALLGNAVSEAIVIEPNNPEKVLKETCAGIRRTARKST